MKRPMLFLLFLGAAYTARAERVVFAGFDVSATAFKGHTNPYDDSWRQVLKTVQGGDHVYGVTLDERGLAGMPVIDFTVRPYSVLSDQRRIYDALVEKKREDQRLALDALLKNTPAAKGTELIGLLHQAGKILAAYPQAAKQVIVFTDGIQEG